MAKQIDTGTLKEVFRAQRDYFAGNVTGISRDESIAEIVIRVLFCKLFDESRTKDSRQFIASLEDTDAAVRMRLESLFEEVKSTFGHVFDGAEILGVQDKDLRYLVDTLQHFEVSELQRDVIADAFEEFIGTAFRGGEGQFFTPRNVVEMMVEVLDPQPGERIIDPACGSGGFLAYAIRNLAKKGDLGSEVVGIDKDSFLSKIARTYTSLLLNRESLVYCENSLDLPRTWASETQKTAALGTFDIVLANPPFGAKIPVIGKELLGQYELGRKDSGKGQIPLAKQAPQILFIERCIQLLKPGGRMAIVLPEGIFGNPSDKYVWEYLERAGTVFGVVSLAQEAFQPSTHTKTSVLFFKKDQTISPVFMAIAENIGHNKNGKTTFVLDAYGQPLLGADGLPMINDDLPEITSKFRRFLEAGQTTASRLGFSITSAQVQDHTYIPDYYDPELQAEIDLLSKSTQYSPMSIGELRDLGWIEIKRGKEIGSHFYGTGTIPFIRTSDIVNWELKIDPIKGVSEEAYNIFSKSQDVRAGDILFVNDGTFLIGRTAIVTELERRILIQSHVKKIRVTRKCPFDSMYLLYLLNTKIVQDQIKAKTFIQATISTIGSRLDEVVLPISASSEKISKISADIGGIIQRKAEIREQTREILERAY